MAHPTSQQSCPPTPRRRQFLQTCSTLALLSGRLSAQDANTATNGLVTLTPRVRPEITTRVVYSMQLEGKLSTPSTSGLSEFPLKAQGNFEFDQRQYPTASDSLLSRRASRRYSLARTTTTVGRDPERPTTLPPQSSLIHLYGKDTQLVQLSPEVRLTRPQVDLLQFACDPLAATGLLPTRQLSGSGESWNVDPWVFAMLTGVDAFITQSVTCTLRQLTPAEALIDFQCTGQGAVAGAATEITLRGTLTFGREAGLIRSLSATMQEKRSASAVNAGLNVNATIEWSQEVATPATTLPDEIPATFPEERQLLLTLVTPWRLLLLHNRNWHVFHETADLVILRLLDNGSLIAQCNLAPAAQLSAGKFTSEEEFVADVERRISDRQGQIVSSTVESDVGGWRIHHVQATSIIKPPQNASQPAPQSPSASTNPPAPTNQTIFWDYYLCSARSGEQYSLLFSHANDDTARFQGAPEQLLKTMTLRSTRPRPALPR